MSDSEAFSTAKGSGLGGCPDTFEKSTASNDEQCLDRKEADFVPGRLVWVVLGVGSRSSARCLVCLLA